MAWHRWALRGSEALGSTGPIHRPSLSVPLHAPVNGYPLHSPNRSDERAGTRMCVRAGARLKCALREIWSYTDEGSPDLT